MIPDFSEDLIRNARNVDTLKDLATLLELDNAKVVFGLDVSTRELHLVFGVEILKAIVKSGQAVRVAVLTLKFDPRTAELDFLIETVTRIKGSCELNTAGLRRPPTGKTVRIYDFKSRKTEKIPARELAPGYVLTTVAGVEGLVYVNVSQVSMQPVRRHKDLSEECKRVIRYYAEATKLVDLRTFDQHLAGLCGEAHPVRELLTHFHIAYVYNQFAKQRIVSLLDRRSLFGVVVRCSFAEQHTVLETLDFESLALARPRVQQIVDYYYTCDWMSEFRRLFSHEKMKVIDWKS